MELLQLIYFCHAAETQNFSDTAKHFEIPASGISQTIKRLENELNVNLFIRTANRISLSNEGKIFYKNIKKSLQLLNDAKSELNDFTKKIAGEIKISVFTNRRIVTTAIQDFKSKCPDVDFLINHEHSADLMDFDIIVSDEDIYNSYFEKTPFISENFCLAVLKDNPISTSHIRIDAQLLSQQRFISMPVGSSILRHTKEICTRMGFVPNITIQSDDPYYLRKYIELGLGIAFVPAISWQEMFSEKVALIEINDYKRNSYLYLNKKRYNTRATLAFFNKLIKYSNN